MAPKRAAPKKLEQDNKSVRTAATSTQEGVEAGPSNPRGIPVGHGDQAPQGSLLTQLFRAHDASPGTGTNNNGGEAPGASQDARWLDTPRPPPHLPARYANPFRDPEPRRRINTTTFGAQSRILDIRRAVQGNTSGDTSPPPSPPSPSDSPTPSLLAEDPRSPTPPRPFSERLVSLFAGRRSNRAATPPRRTPIEDVFSPRRPSSPIDAKPPPQDDPRLAHRDNRVVRLLPATFGRGVYAMRSSDIHSHPHGGVSSVAPVTTATNAYAEVQVGFPDAATHIKNQDKGKGKAKDMGKGKGKATDDEAEQDKGKDNGKGEVEDTEHNTGQKRNGQDWEVGSTEQRAVVDRLRGAQIHERRDGAWGGFWEGENGVWKMYQRKNRGKKDD